MSWAISMRTRIIGALALTFLVTSGSLVVAARYLGRACDHFKAAARVDDVLHAVHGALAREADALTGSAAIRQSVWALQAVERPWGTVLPAAEEARLAAAVRRYREALAVVEASPAGSPARARALERAHADGLQALELATAAVAVSRREVESASGTVRRLILLCLGGLAVLALVVTYFFTRRIVAPLRVVEEATAKIVAGDLTPLPAVSGRNEIAAFSTALNKTMHELEALLAKTRKCASIGALTRSLAEEINTPLHNISLTAEALRDHDRSLSPEERQGLYRDVIAEVDRAQHLVRHLLLFSGMRERPHETMGVSEIIESVLHLTRNHISLAGTTLKVDIPPDLPPVHGDRLQLEQVFLNLVLNAVQAMPEGGELDVRAQRAEEPETLRIDVADTGIGIREQHLAKLFDPWLAFHEPEEGMALGLSVSHGIVRRHGGRIAVQSTYGLGSTFTVYLPVASAQDRAA